MIYRPLNFTLPTPQPVELNWTVNMISPECLGGDIQSMDTALASTAYTANLLVFIPLIVSVSTRVSQFFWINGSAVAGNVDVGIYSEDGATKLASTGSTAASGTSAIQVVNVTDFVLSPTRRYWMALGGDSGAQAFLAGDTTVEMQDLLGIKQQASGWSSGLPSSVTFATPTVAITPLFGITGSATI